MKNIEIYVTVAMLFVATSIFGQTDNSADGYKQFRSSFLMAIKYPEQLTQRCIPTITMMKVKFDEKGKLDSL